MPQLGRLPRRLRTRLLLANLVVAGVALGTVLVAVSLVGPGYFSQAMGHPPGDPAGTQMDAVTLSAFRDAVGAALLAGLIAATSAAIIVSLAISSRIAGPVTRLAATAHRIAAGHYSERVQPAGEGELAELAASFNVMTASLEATERRRLQLVGDVAHELRTPLSTLDGYLEGLEDGVVQANPETWRLLRGETARLSRLVNDLQELWRAEARQLSLRIAAVEVGSITREVVDRFAPQIAARGMRVVTDLPAGLRAKADADRLAQVLSSYLSNAIRYSPDDSTIWLSARRSDDRIVVAVRDQGPGLTAEQRMAVFERFYRIDPSRSRVLGGSGIGLAIARALAEAMDGRAWAESGGPGHGSTFLVACRIAGS